MAESTLSLTWDDMKQAVGFFLGYGSTIANWTEAQEGEIEDIVQSGYRRVLYPPASQGIPAGYEWSFLQPTKSLDIVADDGDYDLPDDYGNIVGKFHYEADEHYPAIRIISVAQLLDMRSASDMNGHPACAAIRPKSSDGSDGQRWEVLFYPEPDADYSLHYTYDAYRDQLSDDYPYLIGGMKMSELYKESCLSVAECRNTDVPGTHTALFERLLVDAVARDMKTGARNFGHMGQPREHGRERFQRGRSLHDGAYEITYHGERI